MSTLDPEAPAIQTTAETRRISRLPGLGRGAAIVAGVLLMLALIGLAGVSYAGYDYSRQYEGRILPGVSVAGVDVGGMTPEAALNAVRGAVRPELRREITVSFNDRTWTVTPRQLGATSNARSAIDAAVAVSEETSFVEKTRMRVFGGDLDFRSDVAISYPRKFSQAFVQGLASTIDQEPQDAALDYSSGWVKIVDEKPGRTVQVDKSVRSLRAALVGGGTDAELFVEETQPAVTADEYDEVLLVRIGENKLYHYEDGKITHEYVVATGLPEYPTPTGLWEVTELRYMPTWVNPAPDTWGANMPESIPPGPSNPLGLRAINWSAPAIRFHGTSATYSLGYNASHGCVRMSNEDAIELYDMVEVGTPIISVEVAPYRPLYTSSSVDPVLVDPEGDPTEESSGGSDKESSGKKDGGN